MIEKYGLFDSLEGDERAYAEVDFARLCRALGPDGVRGGAEALRVSAAAAGLAVNVAAGLAMVQGRYYALEDDGSGAMTLSLSAASASPRVDRIVLQLSFAQRTVTLGVLKGTEAATPTAPALTRSADTYMLSLARVYVPVGASGLTQDSITDERGDETLCGLHVVSAGSALEAAGAAQAEAQRAKTAAESAQTAAQTAMAEAEKRVLRVNNTSPDSTGNVNVQIGVAGAGNGHLAVFDASGNLADSGKALSAFTRAKMSLAGTTLTITTVD